MTLHDLGNDVGNIRKAALPGKEKFHGGLIGGVHDNAGAAPALKSAPCQQHGGEGVRVRLKELQRAAGKEVQRRRIHR